MEGNQMKMREALEKVYTCVDDCDNYDPESKLDEVIGIADAALSAPPRNCDVGTAEEQTARYIKFCAAHKYIGADFSLCKGFGKGRCPFFDSYTKSKCELAWAQMPYEAEEGCAK